MKQAAKSVKRELSEVRVELANKDTVCAGLEVEIQTLKQHLDEERRNCEKLRDKVIGKKRFCDKLKKKIADFTIFDLEVGHNGVFTLFLLS